MTEIGRTKRCFVISPIGLPQSVIRRRADKILNHIIKPVCESLDFLAVRSDEIDHASLISHRMMEEIITAEMVVADLTGANPNVYYEVAVRHFINRPVVLLLESTGEVAFDISGVNTIRFDHTDLDSVHEAKARLRKCIQEIESLTKCPNPISTVLEALNIEVKSRGEERKSLVEQFENFAKQITDELAASKTERELLWKKLFDTPSGGSTEKRLSEIDLSGYWNTTNGDAKLIQVGDSITGKYQFGTDAWVGEINGCLRLPRVVFEFRWTNYDINGIGYWDHINGELIGYWYYADEANYTLEQLKADPTLFDHLSLRRYNGDERFWRLHKSALQSERLGP